MSAQVRGKTKCACRDSVRVVGTWASAGCGSATGKTDHQPRTHEGPCGFLLAQVQCAFHETGVARRLMAAYTGCRADGYLW